METTGIGATASISQITGGLDLEAFMMMVQSQRANNLESQMAGQINDVKERQAQIASMNDTLAQIRSHRPEKAEDGTSISGDAAAKLGAAGLSFGDMKGVSVERDGSGNVTKVKCDNQAAFDALIDGLKAKIDNLNSTSQLDMIRLQSLSNKRNEAFEQLTNAVQKFAKVNESIIGNMR